MLAATACDRSAPSPDAAHTQKVAAAAPAASPPPANPASRQDTPRAPHSPEDGKQVGAEALLPAGGAPLVYPRSQNHSPLTPEVVEHLKAIRRQASRPSDTFIKVGDSITENPLNMGCFTNGDPKNYAGHAFLKGLVSHLTPKGEQRPDPFTRQSLAARVGIDAEWAVDGGPDSPLAREIAVMHPAYALTMFGTNTVSRGGSSAGKLDGDKFVNHFKHTWQAIMLMLERGVIPVLMTAPPHRSLPRADYIIEELNRIVRALAEYHQVPLVDFHHASSSAPDFGLYKAPSGELDVHPRACGSGCDFSKAGLTCGVNIRNLLSMQALERLRKVLDEGQPAPDAMTPDLKPRLAGLGTPSDPYRVDALPFSDLRRLDTGKASALADYSGCARPTAQVFNPARKTGPEAVYELQLASAKRLSIALMTPRASGFRADASKAHRQLFLLEQQADGKRCLGFRHNILQNTLAAGTYYIVVDSEPAAEATRSPYLLMISECPPGDPACEAHEFIRVGPPAESNDPAANW